MTTARSKTDWFKRKPRTATSAPAWTTRTLLSRRGLDGGSTSDALDPDPAPRRTLPAGQSTRKKRKTPFAQIPGQVDVLPPVDDGSSNWNKAGSSTNDPDATSSLDRPMTWLPIAQGTIDPTPRR